MHPAPSVILFTTLSGLGFGLLIWLALGFPAVTGWVAVWGTLKLVRTRTFLPFVIYRVVLGVVVLVALAV